MPNHIRQHLVYNRQGLQTTLLESCVASDRLDRFCPTNGTKGHKDHQAGANPWARVPGVGKDSVGGRWDPAPHQGDALSF